MRNSRTILVTAIGSFSSECVVDSLKALNTDRVVGCDIYPAEWLYVSKKYDVVYQVPLVTKEKSYLNKIIKICQEEKVGYIFPLTDVEVDFFNCNRKAFVDMGIIVCIPHASVLAIARNKFVLSEFVSGTLGIPSVKTYRSSETISSPLFPYIAKPINGRSSEGLVRIYNKRGLDFIQEKDNYILQEIIDGNIFTVDYVRSSKFNTSFSIAREELLRTSNGAGMTVRILADENLTQMVSEIGEKLQLNGCINMEFIKNKNDYYLIDINPRFSAGVGISKLAGYDMVTNHLNCFTGKNILEQIEIQEMIAVKKIVEMVMVS